MTLLKREEWQDIAGDVAWTYGFVDEDAVYPEIHSGTGKVPREAWAAWEESYKVTYPEYVTTQQEKETSTYAVRAALQRSNAFDTLSEGWKSATKMHFGGVALVEYAGLLGELRMARFGLSPRWRNMAVFGSLDEIRHTQITLFFGHEFVRRDPQYDWAQKAFHTNNWITIALRHLFDAMMISPNAVDLAIQLPLTLETGFTNLQFVALASNALDSGDVSFANLISSIQTDEARHAQQGGPTLEILAEHDPARAQWLVDKHFWLSARMFAALTGPPMDYYTAVANRKQSYREFMEEWIVDQFVHTLDDYGLRKPWYWDEFMEGLDIWHHSLHLGLWYWRPTLWWKPAAGVDAESVEWLREKYPNWETVYGDKWRVLAEAVNAGDMARTLPETLPWLCNTCHLPCCNTTYGRDGKWRVRNNSLKHNGVTYHFCSKTCRQIWSQDSNDPADAATHTTTLIERFLAGEVQPMDVPGLLAYMGITPEVAGDDADGYAWAKDYPVVPDLRIATGNGNGAAAPSAESQLVPVNAIFADDISELLVPVLSTNTMTEVADAVAHHVEGRRVRARDLPKVVFHDGRALAPGVTVAQAGIQPLDHIRVDYQE